MKWSSTSPKKKSVFFINGNIINKAELVLWKCHVTPCKTFCLQISASQRRHWASNAERQRKPIKAPTHLHRNHTKMIFELFHDMRSYLSVLRSTMMCRNSITWQYRVKDTQHHDPQVKELHADIVELRNAQPHKYIIGIKQTAQNLQWQKDHW